MSKSAEQIAKELAAFFPVASVGWKPQTKPFESDGKHFAMAVCYIDARDVMDRLDAVVGVDCWKDEYAVLPSGEVSCKLSIKFNGEWVTKQDVGGQSDQEDKGDRAKAACSDALKRAAIKFGVGRYLYSVPKQWPECKLDRNGKFQDWVKQPPMPPAFMNEADKQHQQNLANVGKPKGNDAAKNEPKPPQGAVAAKDIPKTGKALKERLEKANKEHKGILEFVAHCGVLWGYPSDITRWSGDQLKESVSFGKEFARRAVEKTPRIKEEQHTEILGLISGDLEKMQKACRIAQVYAADNLTEAEAAKVIEVLKKGV